MASPFVYLPGRVLSGAELHAACLDGDLVALGEAFVPADMVETPALRAASLVGVLGTDLAATHLTAAWIRGGVDIPPHRLTVQRAVPRRLHHIIDRRLHYRDREVDPDDLEVLGGVAVTTPGRTIADLVRMPGEGYLDAVAEWAARDATVIAAGRAWLTGIARLPHGRRADAVLARIQEEVTR